MIILVGESGSGKSTIQSYLVENYGFKRLVSYTTRPPRNGEVDGVDYHFISVEEFNQKKKDGFFAEIGQYREWMYGSAKEDCTNDRVAVLTPHGLRQMKRIPGLNILSFYIKVPRRDRMIKILERGDDIEEIKRRDSSDFGQFDGIEDEVDSVLNNEKYKETAEFMAKAIYFMYESRDFYKTTNKKKLTILCDIDGVVDNLVECILEKYNEKYHDNLQIKDITQYDMNKFTKPECENVMLEFCNDDTISRMLPLEGSVEAVTKLMEKHNFYFVTSTYPQNVGYKHEWLKRFFPLYNEKNLIVAYNKEVIRGDILIDDCASNMSNNVEMNLLYNQPWNMEVQTIKNFRRVYSWENILDYIQEVTGGNNS